MSTQRVQPHHVRPQRPFMITTAIIIALLILTSVFTGIFTEKLWYDSVGYGSVFSTLILTKVGLFVVFGLLMALIVGASIWFGYRFRPFFVPNTADQAGLNRYRELVAPVRRWALAGVALILGIFAGMSAAGQWRTFLLWANAKPFGQQDPYFHKDAGFYLFSLPWWHFLVSFFTTALVISLIAAVLVQYLYAGIRLSGPAAQRFSGAAQAQVSLLLGLLLALRGAASWLGRYDLVTQHGSLITGMTYTAEHAVLPARNILTFIALICALLLLANVVRRTWLLPLVGIALLALSSVLLGTLWPAVVQRFQVVPSPADKEAPYIAKNIQATRSAYGIDHVKVTEYPAKTTLSQKQLKADAASLPGIRLIDPAVVDQTFDQLQQVRGYYRVPHVLDVDRYQIGGKERDLVVAPRELNLAGLPAGQQNWTTEHTVYTHGYGMIAAYGNQTDANGVPVTSGDPVWAEQDLPPVGQLSNLSKDGYQGRIYYGEQSPAYSIVGKAPGGADVELDLPQGQKDNGNATTTTYAGKGGVAVGGLFRKLLYAIKFGDTNLLLSQRVNQNSRILYDRNPRLRVQKVAPWLTVDSDALPSVVNGRIVWILDGYTTSDRFPLSQSRSLSQMTSDSQNPDTTFANLSGDEINYMRNSVKATVDAYDGTVTLYAWDSQDPILKAWESVFPGVVKPRSAISPQLMAHLRYPEDLFKVQRDVLSQYHVTNPKTFFNGSDRWDIPIDPNSKTGQLQPPYRLSVATTPGQQPDFSLTSVYTPANRLNLAAFMSVGADATKPDSYGNFQVLRLPDSFQVAGPSQVANEFESSKAVSDALLPFRQSQSEAIYGNLLTLPVGGGLLYVQPIYTQSKGGAGAYPQLRFVAATFGKQVGVGPTLSEALAAALGTAPPVTSGGPTTSTGPGGTRLPSSAIALLKQADARFSAANDALKRGDLTTYAQDMNAAQQLVRQALAQAQKPRSTDRRS